MMETLTLDSQVGEFVKVRPANSKVFERLGIDYCCGGKKPLVEVCRQKGLDPIDVLSSLSSEGEPGQEQQGAIDPAHMSLTELADHIENTHHTWLREEFPRINRLIDKVARVHGESYPWLHDIQAVYRGLQSELQDHMQKEEQVLFPIVRQLETGAMLPLMMRAGLEAPIRCMETEHASAGRALEAIRNLSSDFTPPEGACNTFRAMLDALAELESDLHLHVHKENNILFPRALELSGRQNAL